MLKVSESNYGLTAICDRCSQAIKDPSDAALAYQVRSDGKLLYGIPYTVHWRCKKPWKTLHGPSSSWRFRPFRDVIEEMITERTK